MYYILRICKADIKNSQETSCSTVTSRPLIRWSATAFLFDEEQYYDITATEVMVCLVLTVAAAWKPLPTAVRG